MPGTVSTPADDPQSFEPDLRAQVDALQNQDVQEWLTAAAKLAENNIDYVNTVSWRVTRPLRDMRTLQIYRRENGASATMRVVFGAIKRQGRGS